MQGAVVYTWGSRTGNASYRLVAVTPPRYLGGASTFDAVKMLFVEREGADATGTAKWDMLARDDELYLDAMDDLLLSLSAPANSQGKGGGNG